MKKRPKVVVVGSINMDLVVSSDQAPVKGETILGTDFQTVPGGKGANQAVAAARLGAEVSMIACLGDDMNGSVLLRQLENEGIDTTFVNTASGETTGVAVINLLSQGDNSIIVVPGANHRLSPAHVEKTEQALREADVCLIQLEIPMETVVTAVKLARRHGAKVILNPAPAQELSSEILASIDFLTPNETEASLLATGSVARAADVKENVNALKKRMPNTVFVVTQGGKGVYFTDGDENEEYPAQSVEVVDTTAAGDSFNAAMAVKLAEGSSLKEAVAFATKVAAVTVTRFGAQTSLPTREEIVD
ncbi:MAG TPA: ribokinase [Bacillales bacterium]